MKLVFLGLICSILASCESTSVSTPPLHDKEGRTLDQVRTASFGLMPGMTPGQVTTLLGYPDETSGGVYGGSNSPAWEGVTWVYKFGRYGEEEKRLQVTFAASASPWRVNNWEWLP